MRGFPPRDQPPERRPRRELPRPEGPFDRLLRRRPERDPAPFIIGGTIAFLALVIVLVFAFSALLSGGGSDQGELAGLPKGIKGRLAQIPGLPPGLVAVSDFVQFETEGEVTATIGLPLRERLDDPSAVGFYTFLNGRWQKLAVVRLMQNGNLGEGDFRPVPANLAVLRVVAQAYQVAGSLPAGGRLHPDAKVSILSPRDYKPAADGSVQGIATQVTLPPGALLMPTIVGSGQETAAIVDSIMAEGSLRAEHIRAISTLASGAGLAGIDLEYSAVDAAQGSAFTEFVKGLADALHRGRMRLSLTLPPPTGGSQAYDWKALGEAVDIIKVLPIADPLDYWDKMPDALQKITKDVDPRKVMLVLSPFSVERAGRSARPIGYLEAMVLAGEAATREPQDPEQIKPGATVKLAAVNLDEGEGASTLRWSDDAAAVTFSLSQSRGTVFVENSFSARFKLELVVAFGLAGVAVSDASGQSDVANMWPVVNELVEAATVTLVRPNDDALLPRWQAPDGGNLGAGAGTAATWEAPSEAKAYTILLIVSDGEKRFGRKTTVEVKSAPQSTPTAVVTFPPEATATATPSPSATPAAGLLQVGKLAEGDDPDSKFTNDEKTSPGSTVTYLVTIDNDSPGPVTVTSLVDDVYGDVICLDSSGNNVVGRDLAADDGDGSQLNGGPDEVVCTFTAKAPTQAGTVVKDKVTGTVEDAQGKKASDQDDACIATTPVGTVDPCAPPQPSPSPSP